MEALRTAMSRSAEETDRIAQLAESPADREQRSW
jgi:hypothetical protein